MYEPWANWRTTKIPCPSCNSALLRRKRLSATRAEYNYCCVRCGISWQKEPKNGSRERQRAIFGALSIAILIALVYGSHAAAQSICLEVITDGTSVCVDVPTYHEAVHSRGSRTLASLTVVLCAIWVIPLIVGATVHCRNWCGIVSLAIAIGYGAGFVIGPLIVQHRYHELYWDNPSLFDESVHKSLALIILSLPASILATWVSNCQSHAVKLNR
jgi:hypothetical protein